MPTHFSRMKNDLVAVRNRLRAEMFTPVAELKAEGWHTREPVAFADRRSGRHFVPRVGRKWGRVFDCAWFHFTGRVPKSAAGRRVVLLIDLGGEACVVDERGCPMRGLTNVSPESQPTIGDPVKRVLAFLSRARGGEKVDLWADAGFNSLLGEHFLSPGAWREARIAVVNDEVRSLYYDFETLHDLLGALPENTPRHQRLLYTLSEVALGMRRFDEDEARAARARLAPELARRTGDDALRVSAIGHAHIDLAWLWPIRETFRKGARTFATALDLMKRYPDYHFGQPQPQLYAWMKERHPSLYRRIKRRVAEGRWEPLGGLWVECDTNMPSGEALVRQLLYGKRFFRKEFGVDSRIVWLPDSFGYTGALPQIMKQAGIELFVTQKLSWDRYKDYPHHSFHWRGIDGSSVLTHLLPEETYNGSASPAAAHKIERDYLDKAVSDHALMVFGIGDGGGGPGAEHLERLDRIKDLAGLPTVTQEPVAAFAERLGRDADRFATWAGELYLSCHQGTYTTQAANKRGNRKLELALRELEWTATMAARGARARYPAAAIERLWKETLLLQFHDILPGSSIRRVHRESVERYEAMLEETAQLCDKARAAIIRQNQSGGGAARRRPAVVFNPLGWSRREWTRVGDAWRKVEAPPMGWAWTDLDKASGDLGPDLLAGPDVLENDLLRVTFAPDGVITSLWDKEHGREALADDARANEFAVYDDPGDAWDFAIQYEAQTPQRFELIEAHACVEGPRATLRQRRRFGDSTLEQDIVLTAGSRRLEFITRANWRESAKMLRVAFPVGVFATESTSEIQFGSIRRPTHRNTVWEQSMFEICAHRWVDLSDRGYGVALLNDCKYGHKILDNVLDLNLLRSPSSPDEAADRGRHEFTYALYPHAGDHVAGGVLRAAHELNAPLRVVEAPASGAKRRRAASGANNEAFSLVTVDHPAVVVEAVKKAEDDDDTIMRLYESSGASLGTVRIEFGFAVAKVWRVDLMEENARPLRLRGNGVDLTLRPFEIQTLRVKHKA